MGVIFVAGIYGVGKDYTYRQIAKDFSIPFYSAGDLISNINKEQYGANKMVKDAATNQNILISEVERILTHAQSIFLAGHFIILGKERNFIELDKSVFTKLHLDCVVLLSGNPEKIQEHLIQRDSKEYDLKLIQNLSLAERECARRCARDNRIELIEHNMKYDGTDHITLETKMRRFISYV